MAHTFSKLQRSYVHVIRKSIHWWRITKLRIRVDKARHEDMKCSSKTLKDPWDGFLI